MRTIIVYATTNYVGCKSEDEFEVEDDATDEEINETAQVMIAEMCESGWYEKEDS